MVPGTTVKVITKTKTCHKRALPVTRLVELFFHVFSFLLGLFNDFFGILSGHFFVM